jgi:hypothetical protein
MSISSQEWHVDRGVAVLHGVLCIHLGDPVIPDCAHAVTIIGCRHQRQSKWEPWVLANTYSSVRRSARLKPGLAQVYTSDEWEYHT